MSIFRSLLTAIALVSSFCGFAKADGLAVDDTLLTSVDTAGTPPKSIDSAVMSSLSSEAAPSLDVQPVTTSSSIEPSVIAVQTELVEASHELHVASQINAPAYRSGMSGLNSISLGQAAIYVGIALLVIGAWVMLFRYASSVVYR